MNNIIPLHDTNTVLVVDSSREGCVFHLFRNVQRAPSGTSISLSNFSREAKLKKVKSTSHIFSSDLGTCELIDAEVLSFLHKEGVGLSDLSLLVCSLGPGSFTGLRTGMAFSRALSQVLEIPLLLLSPYFACAVSTFLKGFSRQITIASKANSEEFFCGMYEGTDLYDFKITSEISAMSKESEKLRGSIALEDLAVHAQATTFLEAICFVIHQYDSKVFESINKYSQQVKWILKNCEMIEPLYVKPVVAKTLEQRGVKSLLDQL